MAPSATLPGAPDCLVTVAAPVIRIEHILWPAIKGDIRRGHEMDARHEARPFLVGEGVGELPALHVSAIAFIAATFATSIALGVTFANTDFLQPTITIPCLAASPRDAFCWTASLPTPMIRLATQRSGLSNDG